MLRILHDTKYDFIRAWRIMAGATIALIVAGLVALAMNGMNYSIDFTGGTLMQLTFKQPPNVGDIRGALDQAGIHGAEIQQFGTPVDFTVRAQDRRNVGEQASGAENVSQRIQSVLTQRFGAGAFEVKRTEAVGPRVGDELRRNALYAILASFVLTLFYLAFRFQFRFGVAAVLATAHDIFTTLAFIKLMNIEVSLTVIAAILTVIGYSLNDTIIIFDRVRENLKKQRREPLYDVLNRSINETLPRSVLTHATTLAATLALLIFAGEVIRPFAWVMAWGIFTGTFSSIYVAGPMLLWIERRWPRKTDTGSRGASAANADRPTATRDAAGRVRPPAAASSGPTTR
jgi:preprotein translocase subunit SecF